MFNRPSAEIEKKLTDLVGHLKKENPVLIEVVDDYKSLDLVGRRLGLISADESYTGKIPWWPLISVLGTFSAGKSTFINDFMGRSLQRSGNQAVDDKFTVVCYSENEDGRVLPGIALDADIRFPFYKMSEEIERVSEGEGRRIDAYLQLKTTSSEIMKGKILIDSPGFDADEQRTSTLKITDHIIDLSDLVLVFFDARHPEPGAMQDTLEHLVGNTIHRNDSNKFLFILNQIDTTAKENNPEDVVGAWQRALSQKGLTAGRFYCIYNEKAAVPIEDETLRARFKKKKDEDLNDIMSRIRQVEVERSYRIVGSLEKLARDIEDIHLPKIAAYTSEWSKKVLTADIVTYSIVFALLLYISISNGYWDGFSLNIPFFSQLDTVMKGLVLFVAFFALAGIHYLNRSIMYKWVSSKILNKGDEQYILAFNKNTAWWRSIFRDKPVGWSRNSKKRIKNIIANTAQFVQRLNNQFTNPSGESDNKKVSQDEEKPVIAEQEQVEAVAEKKPEANTDSSSS